MQTTATSPALGSLSGQSSRSWGSARVNDDVTSLTSFNPFSEEDENDTSSYALVTSLISRVKNSLSAPLTSTQSPAPATAPVPTASAPPPATEARRPAFSQMPTTTSLVSNRTSGSDRPHPLITMPASAAPPLMSLTPAQSEIPTYAIELDNSTGSRSLYSPGLDASDSMPFGTSIPGFPIQDDARSIITTTSMQRSGSVSRIMRRLRGEGLSRDYWMDDENCKECYDCKSVFTTWRRKHHCRICGQIFCSRCASNILKGTRFNAGGMVRVCNLCMNKLAKVDDDDDEDDRRSISSSVAFTPHQLGMLDPHGHPPSPFVAGQLFGRAEDAFNLYSIAETKCSLSEPSSRPDSPYAGKMWEPIREQVVPFRRGVADEERVSSQVGATFNTADSSIAKVSDGKVAFPTTKALTLDGTSSILFPLGSPEQAGTPLTIRTAVPYADIDVPTPFIRSRVQSRLDPLWDSGEPGWRTRRESAAYAQDLNLNSMHHLQKMLRQMLVIEDIPNILEWETTLLRLAMRIAREMTFTSHPHRQGQDMDVRRYVKIKKIPGGSPKDSEFVTGAVITKNVAHKQMSRSQSNPRIMLVTFPLEFSRVEGQYLHFGQILRQEKEYLGNLASRIAALRPHIVLVEKSVSRLALDALAKHNIAVARSVKPSAIATIARMTQGDVFSSMDKLALEPRLGHCARYRIQTYDHPLIPGQRKTYMRFEGCNKDMGCTIILRGADLETLRRIKKVTRFLAFVVRNLKLETHLWKDSVITLPADQLLALSSSTDPRSKFLSLPSASSIATFQTLAITPETQTTTITAVPTLEEHDDLPDEDAERIRLSKRIDDALDPYTKTSISVSATLRFPPPYPIRRMKELDKMLLEAKGAWEDEVVRTEEKLQVAHKQESTITPSDSDLPPAEEPDGQPVEEDDLVAQIDALPVFDLPSTPLSTVGLLTGGSDDSYFSVGMMTSPIGTPSSANFPSSSPAISFLPPEDPEKKKNVDDISLQSNYKYVKWLHEETRRVWEWYLRKNVDDFVIEKYQCIYLREYTIPTSEIGRSKPCFAPKLDYIKFYGENDMTLGQFVEKSIHDMIGYLLDPTTPCGGKGCDNPLANHCKVFVHDERCVTIAAEQSNFRVSPDIMTTWTVCRVCDTETPSVVVSPETQRYSFFKFLELYFYPSEVQFLQGAGCEHNVYQHHIRYVSFRGLAVRFQSHPIILHEIVFPPSRIRIQPQNQLAIKNNDFDSLHLRNATWYSGLVDDLKLISMEGATGDEDTDARLLAYINALISRADAEREEITRLINQIYRESAPTDTLALNQAHAYRQDKIVAWEQDFDQLPRQRSTLTIASRNNQRGSKFGIPWRHSDFGGTGYDSLYVVSSADEASVRSRKQGKTSTSASDASESEANPEVDEKDVPAPKAAEIQGDFSSEKVTLGSSSPKEEAFKANLQGAVSNSGEEPEVDSDSTIAAGRGGAIMKRSLTVRPPPVVDEALAIPTDAELDIAQPKADVALDTTAENFSDAPLDNPQFHTVKLQSRLPRPSNQLKVSDLVKKYQEFLPAQGVQELAHTALGPRPVMSESEQEYPSPYRWRSPGRTKPRHNRIPLRKASTSDFEQGYPTKVPARYPGRTKKDDNAPGTSRALSYQGYDSHTSSRRASPEKRSRTARKELPMGSRASSPSVGKGSRPSNLRVVSRPKDKASPRLPPSASSARGTFRRSSQPASSRVQSTIRQWERMGKDPGPEKSGKTRYAVIRRRARPVASSTATVEILPSLKDAIADDSEVSDSSSEADDEGEGHDEDRPRFITPAISLDPPLPTELVEIPGNVDTQPEAEPPVPPSNSIPSETKPEESNRAPPPGPITLPSTPLNPDKGKESAPIPTQNLEHTGGSSILYKTFSSLWPPTSRNSVEFDDPVNDAEHIFRDASMIVRVDEFTSSIALALNSPQYRELLTKSRAEKRTVREAKLTEGEAFMPDDKSVAESASTWGVVNVDPTDSADPADDLRVPSSKQPWAITFESGDLTISCTILYPEQFDALRRTYDCEKSMVESLSRCMKWDASGGKSGSAFLKTKDDRFIAKELSKPELQTMETFAPAYFDYMSAAVNAKRPTLLAKIFGCYKVTFKKSDRDSRPSGRNKSFQMNLLVMENLFYGRTFSKIYDLKGSTRNRHVLPTGKPNEVLLDENLVETAHRNPFYIREHSKRILRGALYNDSKFLADINVMDYSLVCGVDDKTHELVVGIVDYQRTYTWDKKLETWVKESTFLGGPGRGEPTIVTPKQYRQRFISAMERYFPLVPDRWTKQRDTPEEDTAVLTDLWPDW